MSAFDRVPSGIPALDGALDNIRLGDNVVFQLSELSEFSLFTEPFLEQSLEDGRDVIYIRFASHEPLVAPREGVRIFELNPNSGFETFTVSVRRIITEQGPEAFYIFDCLSELQTAWSSDMMMGNFFRVTCPYLFELDTVAYFPVLRGRHSFSAIAKIRDTTQLLIDVKRDDDERVYVHPLKVWNRYSPTMFSAHCYNPEDGTMHAITDGLELARYFSCMNDNPSFSDEPNIDSWDRFFIDARHRFDEGTLTERECSMMCNMMMTKDTRMRKLVKRFFTPTDYFTVRDHMVGTGLVGGKTCGMLVARKIIDALAPETRPYMESHDSFYVGSDVFYTYIVSNDLWKLRIAQSGDGFVTAAPALREGIEQGVFPEDIRERFMRILDYYGQSPIIVRSSSFLEDGFGNAFAGKYDSVFCPNVGDMETRLSAFEDAVRHVYASSLDPSALEYRKRNGLDTCEEQMSLLVMRVSGSQLPDGSFMPTAAGVGYSHSAYCWMPDMDPSAGMIRLVMGLGTKAVDRTGQDYPRIVSLDRPLATTAKTPAEKHRYSQQYANVIDLGNRAFSERSCEELSQVIPASWKRVLFEHDRPAEDSLRSRGAYRPVLFASCEGLVKNRRFTELMRMILHTLEDTYDNPVDIEFTVNVGEGDEFIINLLQCRPLKSVASAARVHLPALEDEHTLFHIRDASMGQSRAEALGCVVFIDPERYYRCPHAKKPSVASLVGRANSYVGKAGMHGLLLAPGRLGTSSPELGVPTTFADICNFAALCEVGYSGAGYSPELSYGSHMFQDLVEADIFYGALFENDRRLAYHPELLDALSDVTVEAMGDDALSRDEELAGIVRVFAVRQGTLMLWHDMLENESVCGFA